LSGSVGQNVASVFTSSFVDDVDYGGIQRWFDEVTSLSILNVFYNS
jgi:hypothetical protein